MGVGPSLPIKMSGISWIWPLFNSLMMLSKSSSDK
eukprot:CCRYP_016592-RA/>CCRYP_016592-RA protein AED:0.39 eAED:0.39 QI:46/1/1/1/0/0/2/82/34